MYDCVINGSKARIVDEVKKQMESGRTAKSIIDVDLIEQYLADHPDVADRIQSVREV